MKILALYYTHNQIKPEVLDASLKTVQQAKLYANLKKPDSVYLAVSLWQPLALDFADKIYLSHFREKGHINICLQLLRILYEQKDFDLVCFLEHDMLYAPNYFDRILHFAHELRKEKQPHYHLFSFPDWILNMDYMGMNEKGYQTAVQDRCLSQSAMRYDYAMENLERALYDCIVQGWCYLEPQDKEPEFLPAMPSAPNVHVNMNGTAVNHHLTNHYSLYREASEQEHPLWGDYKQYNIF